MNVRENRLSDPSRIGEADYLPFVRDGSAWVAEIAGKIVGFSAAAESSRTVWAMFVEPEAEGSGVGAALHTAILDWARDRGLDGLSLSTTNGTRAADFYRRHGWRESGRAADGEVSFERAL